MNQYYTGQSYVPLNNDWLPLPGRDRRRRRRRELFGSVINSHPQQVNEN